MSMKKSVTMVFTDLTLLLACGFVALFVVLLLMIKKENKRNDIRSNAEFIVYLEWPSEYNNDVDLHVEDPMGNHVFFQNREVPLMHLDRDDLGNITDSLDGKEVMVFENQELVTVRRGVSGEYVVNAHMYLNRTGVSTPVTARLVQVKPFREMLVKKTLLNETGDEATLFRFTLNADGEYVSSDDTPKYLLR